MAKNYRSFRISGKNIVKPSKHRFGKIKRTEEQIRKAKNKKK